MTASDRQLGWQRALCLVLLLFGAQALPLAGAGSHGGTEPWVPPIPYPEAGNDALAVAPREWTLGETRKPQDVTGRARDLDAGEVAFRFLSDISAFEGVIAAPDDHNVIQPLAHVGIRWHAITFDPPLHFPGNRTLERVTAGALNWTVPAQRPLLSPDDAITLRTWTSIPVPNNGSSAPDAAVSQRGHTPDPEAPLWIALSFSFADAPRSDPDTGTRSPAMARFAAALWVNRTALHNPVTLYDTNAILSFHHDFGAASRGISTSTDRPVNATGLYLERGLVYSTARILDRAHGWGDGENVTGRMFPAVTTFHVPPYGRLPHATPSSLLSPITLNVTVPMAATRANITSWALPDGPRVASDGNGAIVYGETGFLADGPLAAQEDGNETAGAPVSGSPPSTPGAAVGVVLLALAALAWAHRPSTHRTTRKR